MVPVAWDYIDSTIIVQASPNEKPPHKLEAAYFTIIYFMVAEYYFVKASPEKSMSKQAGINFLFVGADVCVSL